MRQKRRKAEFWQVWNLVRVKTKADVVPWSCKVGNETRWGKGIVEMRVAGKIGPGGSNILPVWKTRTVGENSDLFAR